MDKKTSPIARVFAVAALLASVAIVFIVVTTSTGNDEDAAGNAAKTSKSSKQNGGGEQTKKQAMTYEVQPDDTLSAIAAENGVTVEEIQALNPDLDPQALQAGQTLKLR